MENLMTEKSKLIKALFVLAIVVAVYFAVRTLVELKNYQFIGAGATATNTVSFEGSGEVSALPDLATVSLTLRNVESDLESAQSKVTATESKVLAFLEGEGIEKKDVKTENYSSYPKYEWQKGICSVPLGAPEGSIPSSVCTRGENVLVGYEVSESISVKVRDLTNVGTVVAGLGSIGVYQMNGPNFSIDDEDTLKAEARRLAIADAKAKAEVLARDLGVSLVRIVSFSEFGSYPEPYYGRGVTALDYAESAPAKAPELPTGENKIISNVSITYEIR